MPGLFNWVPVLRSVLWMCRVKSFGSSEMFLLWTEEFSVTAGGWGRWKLHWQVLAWEAGCSGHGGKVSGCVGILEHHARAPCPAIAASFAPGSPVALLCPRPCSLWGPCPLTTAHNEGSIEVGTDATPPSLCLETVGCDPSHFTVLCFPFIFPSQIHSLAHATCRTGKTPFAQALLSTSGIHFLPAPSLLRCWRHILPFAFTPRAAGLWLGQDVTVGLPSCCTIPGRVDRLWGHHCHPKGTLLLALPPSSLVLGPSHLPAFQLL